MEKATQWTLVAIVTLVGGTCVCCGGVALLGMRFTDSLFGVAEIPKDQSFEQFRENNPTKLINRGPAPQDYDRQSPPSGVEEVTYTSGGLQLKAWVERPRVDGASNEEPAPALVFLHGGFAFGSGDLEAVSLAVEKGFVVMAPMLRGENGNPGDFELFRAEADDAAAAARWLSEQAYVDSNRIYAFGHSVGGGVSAILSLLDDVPIQHSGSSGGLYPSSVFFGWADIVPFESTPQERTTRLLVGNISLMKREHYAYLGTQDSLGDAAATAEAEMQQIPEPMLSVHMIPGDHFSSFDGALRRYLELIQAE